MQMWWSGDGTALTERRLGVCSVRAEASIRPQGAGRQQNAAEVDRSKTNVKAESQVDKTGRVQARRTLGGNSIARRHVSS